MIVKRQIPNLARRRLFRCDQAFANEINAYTEITPQFHKIARNIDLPIPFVDCLFAGADELGEIVVLEDLRTQGFRMANRLKGLDYMHCKIVLQVCMMEMVSYCTRGSQVETNQNSTNMHHSRRLFKPTN